ncbi:hypothetical protein ACFLQI_00355, partial [Candidatus Undinarchaeota archaeon]
MSKSLAKLLKELAEAKAEQVALKKRDAALQKARDKPNADIPKIMKQRSKLNAEINDLKERARQIVGAIKDARLAEAEKKLAEEIERRKKAEEDLKNAQRKTEFKKTEVEDVLKVTSDEKKKHEEEKKKYEEEVKQLEHELEIKEEEWDEFTASVAEERRKEIEELETANNAAAEKIKEIEKERDEVEKTLQETRKVAKKSLKTKKEEAEALQKQLKEVKSAHADDEEEKLEKDAQIHALDEKIAAKDNEIKVLETDVTNKEEALEEKATELHTYASTLVAQRKKIRALAVNLTTTKQENAKLAGKTEALEGQLSEFKDSLADIPNSEEILESVQKGVTSQVASIDELRESLNSHQAKSESQIAPLKEEIQNLTSKVDEDKLTQEDLKVILEQELNGIRKELESNNSKIDSNNSKIESFEEYLKDAQELRDTLKDTQEQLQTLLKSTELSNKERKALEAQLKGISERLEISTIEAKIEEIKTQNVEIKKQNVEIEKQNVEIKDKVKKIEKRDKKPPKVKYKTEAQRQAAAGEIGSDELTYSDYDERFKRYNTELANWKKHLDLLYDARMDENESEEGYFTRLIKFKDTEYLGIKVDVHIIDSTFRSESNPQEGGIVGTLEAQLGRKYTDARSRLEEFKDKKLEKHQMERKVDMWITDSVNVLAKIAPSDEKGFYGRSCKGFFQYISEIADGFIIFNKNYLESIDETNLNQDAHAVLFGHKAGLAELDVRLTQIKEVYSAQNIADKSLTYNYHGDEDDTLAYRFILDGIQGLEKAWADFSQINGNIGSLLASSTAHIPAEPELESKEELQFECPECKAIVKEHDAKCPSCGVEFESPEAEGAGEEKQEIQLEIENFKDFIDSGLLLSILSDDEVGELNIAILKIHQGMADADYTAEKVRSDLTDLLEKTSNKVKSAAVKQRDKIATSSDLRAMKESANILGQDISAESKAITKIFK